MNTLLVAVDTRTAAVKFVAVAAVFVVLVLVGAIKLELRWWTASGASNIPAAKDVDRLMNAGEPASLEASTVNLARMVNGINIKTTAGAAVVEHQVPGVADRLAEQTDELRARVAAVPVDTATGRRLQDVLRRGLLATKIMYHDLASGAVRHRTSERAVRQWISRTNRLRRWYVDELRAVVNDAPLEDRQAVAAALIAP